ncbi:hypothetical protein [Carnobacterium maltaromaticum]|uniref:hypothetical protein n=1 Tax=Carnobacterium maltaromaticum TaxID=2751 RepID=UPI00191BB217|nr:hypothetical protein [Carnobacterium maltaromaticum]CAD5898426.1 conserved hypothetical protein [Carnobacterium maltaromaticum]
MSLENLVSNKTFTWRAAKDQKIFISYNEKQIMIIKGAKAKKLLKDLSESDAETEQYLLARITGNFKRGNEKLAKNMNK